MPLYALIQLGMRSSGAAGMLRSVPGEVILTERMHKGLGHAVRLRAEYIACGGVVTDVSPSCSTGRVVRSARRQREELLDIGRAILPLNTALQIAAVE